MQGKDLKEAKARVDVLVIDMLELESSGSTEGRRSQHTQEASTALQALSRYQETTHRKQGPGGVHKFKLLQPGTGVGNEIFAHGS